MLKLQEAASNLRTSEGILFNLKKSIWVMVGAYFEFGTPEEMKKLLDKLIA